MHKRRSRMVTLAVVLCILALGAAQGAWAAEKITIRHLGYYWHGDDWQAYMNGRIAEFEKSHPNVKIERVVAGLSDELEDKFTAMVAGGIAPDVVEMTLSQGGGMAPKGVFMDLRPFLAKEKSLKITDFAQPAINALTWVDGSLWGLPMDVYPVTTFFNADMFNKVGLPLPNAMGAGWTWDAVTASAKKLTVDANGDGKPDQWGIDNAWQLISNGPAVKQAGGGYYDRYVDPLRADLLNERTIAGLEWVASIYHQGVNAPDYDINLDMGKSGMSLVLGPPFISTFSKLAKFEWGIAPPPKGPDNNGSYVAVNSMQMSKYTKNADIVWEWMKFLASDKENLQEFVRVTNRIPSYLPVTAQYPKLIGKSVAGIQSFSDIINNPKSYHPPVGPASKRTNDLIFYGFMGQCATGNKAVRPVMESLQTQVNAILDEVHKKK